MAGSGKVDMDTPHGVLVVNLREHMVHFGEWLKQGARSNSTCDQYQKSVASMLRVTDIRKDDKFKLLLERYSKVSWPVKKAARSAYLVFMGGAKEKERLDKVARAERTDADRVRAKLQKAALEYMEKYQDGGALEDIVVFIMHLVDANLSGVVAQVETKNVERAKVPNETLVSVAPSLTELDELRLMLEEHVADTDVENDVELDDSDDVDYGLE